MSKTIDQLAAEYEAACTKHAAAENAAYFTQEIADWAFVQKMETRQEAEAAKRCLLEAAAGDAA